jgi:flavodoxin
MPKILIAYYSRTGVTKKIAEALREKLNADIEEIKDTVNRDGMKGYLISGKDAMQRKLTKLEPIKLSPRNYNLVVIGTPIWGWNVSVPIRTYLAEQKDNFHEVAFFCTMGGSGDEKAFRGMEQIVGQAPKATLALRTVEVVKDNFSGKLDEFAEKLAPGM